MYKQFFPFLKYNKNLVYLDSAATSQKPEIVIKSLENFYKKNNCNIHRTDYNLATKTTNEYENVRNIVADFINAKDKNSILFTNSATHSFNLLSESLLKKEYKGKVFIITEIEHNSNFLPWQKWKKYGIKLKIIPFDKQTGELNLTYLDKILLENKNKIIGMSVSHCSNVLGIINPIKEITQKVHKYGGFIIIDACQSIMHINIDVTDLDCDFLVFSGHKIYVPLGTGVLYVKPELKHTLNPYWLGGGIIESMTNNKPSRSFNTPFTKEVSNTDNHKSFNKFNLFDFPLGFEAGTQNISGIIGLGVALEFIQKIGKQNIFNYEKEIFDYAFKELSNLDFVDILANNKLNIQKKQNTPNKDITKRSEQILRTSLISFTINKIHPHDVSYFLNKENIAVRTGMHCAHILHKALNLNGSIRISFGMYNDKSDIDKLIVGLKKLKSVL